VARDVAQWKARVREAWPGITIERPGAPMTRLRFGERARIEARVALNGLAPDDVAVEVVLQSWRGDGAPEQRIRLIPEGAAEDGRQRYALDLAPEHCGKLTAECARSLPPLLTHRSSSA
jgi:starch phosphorylase